ncbi:hypothetical protein PRU_1761 [Xylanibacter ruminicola 23]|uniref:O-Antigen ligase n=1 Tax=Xylanibacter ruminicola (strain ATCC 19189 / DSM 19721 / CIP 105475 / JCM 8958 / 23) TaxID=264731 RepID=D5ETU9_XYLR2|nr:hypothetical protein PRU_1761 [Xylanibacter ruminicola 23]
MAVQFAVQIPIIILIVIFKDTLCPKREQPLIIKIWFIWVFFEVIRGFIVADNEREYKQLAVGTIGMMMPLYIYLFYNPKVAGSIFRCWYSYAILLYFVLFGSSCQFTQFYFSPLLVLFCTFPLYKGKIKYVIIIVGVVYMLVNAVEARAQFVKGLVALTIGLGLCFRSYIYYQRILKVSHLIGYLLVAFIFLFAFSDTWDALTGRSYAWVSIDNNKSREYEFKDTRSLLYVDIIQSMKDNNQILWGCSPARGFKVNYSWVLIEYGYNSYNPFNKGERHKNEMVLANIFLWCGIIGLILFSLIYMRGSYLALYKSRNKIVPMIGCFVAFRWSFGWIEDVNNFLIYDVDLWLLIAMCYSKRFRYLSDKQIEKWFNSLLPSIPLYKR